MDVKMKMMKTNTRKMNIYVVATLLFVFVFGASGVYASTVTRSFSSTNPIECSSINVSLSVDVTGTDTFYAIDEVYPNGWTVTNPGTLETQQSGHLKTLFFQGTAVDTQYNYTIRAPCSVGAYIFSGEYGFDDLILHQMLGLTTVNVLPTPDTTPPAITIIGGNPTSIVAGGVYVDAGASAFDNIDGDLTGSIVTTSNVNSNVVGAYRVIYNVTDLSGNRAGAIRIVNVNAAPDTTPPRLSILSPLTSSLPKFFNRNVSFVIGGNEQLAICKMSVNNWVTNITMTQSSNLSVWSGLFDTSSEGNVSVKFWCNDASGNINNSLSIEVPMSSPPFVGIDLNEWHMNQTTNFSNYTKGEMQRINNVTFGNGFGNIMFLSMLNISSDITIIERIKVSQRRIFINSTLLPQFNKSAKLTFYNILGNNITIKKDGAICNITECKNVDFNVSKKQVIFEVDGFSEYTIIDQCSDGIQNGGESGVDCGGECNACPVTSSGGSRSSGGGGGGARPKPANTTTNSTSNQSITESISSNSAGSVGLAVEPPKTSGPGITGLVTDEGEAKSKLSIGTIIFFALIGVAVISGALVVRNIRKIRTQRLREIMSKSSNKF